MCFFVSWLLPPFLIIGSQFFWVKTNSLTTDQRNGLLWDFYPINYHTYNLKFCIHDLTTNDKVSTQNSLSKRDSCWFCGTQVWLNLGVQNSFSACLPSETWMMTLASSATRLVLHTVGYHLPYHMHPVIPRWMQRKLAKRIRLSS